MWRAFACAGNGKNGTARTNPPQRPLAVDAHRLRSPRQRHRRRPSLPRQAAVSAVVAAWRLPRLRKRLQSRRRRRWPPLRRPPKSSTSSRRRRSVHPSARNLRPSPRNLSRPRRVPLGRHRRQRPQRRRRRRPCRLRRSAHVRARSFPVPRDRAPCRGARHSDHLGPSRQRRPPAASGFRIAAKSERAAVVEVDRKAAAAPRRPSRSGARRESAEPWIRKK